MNEFKDDPRICGKKVLLVNECSKFRFFVSTAISFAGGSVVEAGCGCELAKKLEEEKPDIVLIDIDVPEIDGIQTVKELLRGDGSCGKAVLMTAFSQNIKRIIKNEPLIEANLLGRPFSTLELLNKVVDVAGNKPSDLKFY